MENIYIISDLHGQGKAFFRMLNKIKFSEADIMYILGDVIDRGPDGIPLLEYIRRQPNMKMILGNHEDMMLKSTRYPTDEMWIGTWMFNGGGTTLNGLRQLSKENRRDCLDYVRNLPLYRIISVSGVDYLLIHAGLPMKEGSLEEICRDIDEEEALWIRGEFFNSPVIPPYYIIFGHTPTGAMLRYADTLPADQQERCSKFRMVFWNRRIGIDCGAAYGKNLGCLRLNDFKEYYVKV